jgi:hypothetical protein
MLATFCCISQQRWLRCGQIHGQGKLPKIGSGLGPRNQEREFRRASVLELCITRKLDDCLAESQRDFVPKPRDARHELPWETEAKRCEPQRGSGRINRPLDAIPLGLGRPAWCPQAKAAIAQTPSPQSKSRRSFPSPSRISARSVNERFIADGSNRVLPPCVGRIRRGGPERITLRFGWETITLHVSISEQHDH